MSKNFGKDPRAGTFEGWIVALSILAKYDDRGMQGWPDIGAGHEVIYLTAAPAPLSCRIEGLNCICELAPDVKPDADTLESLGFYYDGEIEHWAAIV